MKIWNVTTGQLLKSFPGVDGPAWSPDGQEIAYTDEILSPASSSAVTILDVDSGQKVYTYHVASSKGQSVDLSRPTWSPDGKYIVTIAIEQASALVQVWVA